MNIEIKDLTFPIWYEEQDITVQILDEDGDLVECNHAGAEEVKVEVYGSPWDTRTETMCDKCGVYWNKYESKWEQ